MELIWYGYVDVCLKELGLTTADLAHGDILVIDEDGIVYQGNWYGGMGNLESDVRDLLAST